VLMLSVFRDGTLHGQAELTTQGLRIGRGSENDIVLEDAAKRVSRLHAELRLEGDGVVTLTDLQSANGTWIAGERVAIEALEPGVPFTIGPYRLMLEEAADTAVAEDSQERPAAEISTAAARDSAAPPPATVPVPAPKRKGDTTKTQGWKAAAGVMDLATRYRWAALIGGIAIVAVAGLGIYAISRNGESSTVDAAATTPVATPPVETTPPASDPNAAHLDEADRLLVQGDKTSAETALRDHILPVLQTDPAHARALDLKAVAERIITPVAPTTTPSTPGPGSSRPGSKPEDQRAAQNAARLAEARGALERGDFKGAVAVLDSLLGDAPDYADAKSLQTRVLAERLDAARKLMADGEELVKTGKLVEAVESFRRADATDPSVSVAPRIAEVRARMQQEGETAFIDGYNFSMAQRPDQAIPLLQKAYRYLPDGHRDKQAARNELERLRVPVR
jgi:predicted component of type VI protein secretion system